MKIKIALLILLFAMTVMLLATGCSKSLEEAQVDFCQALEDYGDAVRELQNVNASTTVEELESTSDGVADAREDVMAAIDYILDLNPSDLILLGSSYSASLAILEGLNNPRVQAVIAFSPGEYFGRELRMQDSLKTCTKPLFVAVTKREKPYVKQMLHSFPEDDYTLFQPDTLGVHGARALGDDNPNKDEYWLAMLIFISKFKK